MSIRSFRRRSSRNIDAVHPLEFLDDGRGVASTPTKHPGSKRFSFGVTRKFGLGSKKLRDAVQDQRTFGKKLRAAVEEKNAPSNYLEFLSDGNSVTSQDLCLDESFPMHTVTIQDLLSFEKLPDHETVKAMGKHVIPEKNDTRPVIFISHQWTAYSHPDPTNRQFEVLQNILKLLLAGMDVFPTEAITGVNGTPKRKNFAKMLQNCLIWIDFISVPQAAITRCHARSSTDVESIKQKDQMMAAINSIPAYIKRSSLMVVLAPVVQHQEERTDCQFSSWKSRGWCRLEAITHCLVGEHNYMDYMLLVESSSKATLIVARDMLFRDSVGLGQFACCKRNHMITVDGVTKTIPCDQGKVSVVLSHLFSTQLEILARKNQLDKYRFLLAHEHVIMQNLPGESHLNKLDTWPEFARAYHVDENKPLKKSNGSLCSPFMYAVTSMNVPLVRFLLEQQANVNEKLPWQFAMVAGCQPLHMIMKVGHGERGKKILDLLIDAKASPYNFARGTHWAKVFGFLQHKHFDPFAVGTGSINWEMVRYYMSKIPVRWTAPGDHFRGANEGFVVIKGTASIVEESLERGAMFQTRNKFGMGALAVFSIAPKELQFFIDTKVLDALEKHGRLGDIDTPLFNHPKRCLPNIHKLSQLLVWHLVQCGFFQENGLLKGIHSVYGGTCLHAAAYRNKPEVIKWL